MAKRKTSTKSPKKTARPEMTPEAKRKSWFIAAGIALLLIIAAVAFYQSRNVSPAQDVLVTVNGEPITQQRLLFHYSLLPPEYQMQMDEAQVLEQIIDEELVVQAARAEGMAATPSDVNERIQQILATNQLTAADLEENLAFFNVTMEEFEELIARQLTIERYTNSTIEVPEPSEEELQQLYALGEESFATPEQVTVRHVLISTQRTDAALVAKDVYDAARAGEDFCVLVRNYTDDRGSLETCGQYTFPRGFMVPEFENASFAMEDGEVRLVQSQFGYHVIERLNMTPAGVRSFEEVREQLEAQVRSAEYLRQYEALVSRLRDEADIRYAGATPPAATGEVIVDAEPIEEPAAPMEPLVPEPEPSEPVQPSRNATAVETDALLSCIAGRATLYGASWSSGTRDALRMFTDAGVEPQYVLCDQDGPCTDIEAYPTWVVDGKQHLGRLSVEDLRTLTGC